MNPGELCRVSLNQTVYNNDGNAIRTVNDSELLMFLGDQPRWSNAKKWTSYTKVLTREGPCFVLASVLVKE